MKDFKRTNKMGSSNEYPIKKDVSQLGRQDYSDSGRMGGVVDKFKDIDPILLEKLMEMKAKKDTEELDQRGPVYSERPSDEEEYTLDEKSARFKNLIDRMKK